MVPAMNTTLYCNKCGAPNSVEAQFCSRCGSALNPVPAVRSPAEAVAAAPVMAGPYTPVSAAAVGYGGFWIRVVAFIIDAIIDAIIVRAVAWPVSMILGLGGLAGIAGGFPLGLGLHLFGSGVVLMLVLFGSWLYEAVMLGSPYHAALGEMVFGMKVTELSGKRS